MMWLCNSSFDEAVKLTNRRESHRERQSCELCICESMTDTNGNETMADMH